MFAPDGSTIAPGRELALGLLAGGVLYFAPTLVAIARHRGSAPLTFYLNLLLGWTGVGWLMAWVSAFGDRRLRLHVSTSTTASAATGVYPWQAPLLMVAPDDRHWWDGYVWRDGWQVAPRGALWSPDGSRWFTGVRWIPARTPDAEPGGPPISSGTEGELPDEPEWWRRGVSGKR
jgi:hypothetical protein